MTCISSLSHSQRWILWVLLQIPISTNAWILSSRFRSDSGAFVSSRPSLCAFATENGILAETNSSSTTTTTTSHDKIPTLTSSLNQESLEQRKFPRTWVPLASTYEIDPDRPSPLEFLGQNYVCYRDNNQKWVVMDDCCPHRLVPLSEGRINRASNSLQCSYHGWEFNSDGNCIRIPQATPEIEKVALSSQRSCVASYPVHIEKNVIWFWPWSEDPLSIASEPSKHPEGLMSGAIINPSTYTRDLPYGWDTLVENLIDPSHVPFAHHGLQGKREDAIPINMTVPQSLGAQGFRFEWQDRTMGMLRSGTGSFQAPFAVVYDAKYQSDTPRDFKLSVLCIPTKPGWSRAIILGPSMELPNDHHQADRKQDLQLNAECSVETQPTDKNKNKKRAPSLMRRIFKLIPVWMVHQLNNRFLDSDLAFLHYQEHERQRRDSYYMPAPSDRCIAALRSWVPKYTDMAKVQLPLALTRSQMFDRWSQHTSKCVHCQRGLKTLQNVRRSSHFFLALSIVGFKYNLAKVIALLCLGALQIASKIEKNFREGDFRHYENN
ncbi:ring-hydroxylating dioxygenase, large terminal subunit [Nitzschia inconspicua]|uniref:Ring-hydroxylating dioxygenase, large terminal subunit n=1 Tax=Nitzschia inconspicua TaxID=303405 RepID=A0A9K3K992_9STRA|nr:ring-hydroxylating dioxygenase, large terminal subunit [Nitzschia inconspicua]KAG7359498.1 ring-hydroxylating dioxygenase, large terminal subunit [Nitzschia inconspicua]